MTGVEGSGAVVDWGKGGGERMDELVKELHRSAEEEEILASPLLDALEEEVIFLDQGVEQGSVIGRDAGHEVGEGSVFLGLEVASEFALDGLAALADLLDDGALAINGGGSVDEVAVVALDDSFLLAVEHHQHLAVLAEFVTEAFDQFLEFVIHVGSAWGWTSHAKG